MDQHAQTQSAKIYAFPARVRTSAAGSRAVAQPSLTPVIFSPVASTSFGSGWYHEAAIEEEAHRTVKS